MKKKSSNDIKKMIIMIVLLMLFVLIGLIIFLFTVDIKKNPVENNQNQINTVEEKREIQDSSKNINLSNYELLQQSSDGKIEVKLVSDKVFFSIRDEERHYNDIEVDVKENTIQDIFIGMIGEKDYLLMITDKGSIGIMEVDNAVKKNRFEIDDDLITFEKEVIRIENANIKLANGEIKTIIVFTSDGNKYDLSDFA